MDTLVYKGKTYTRQREKWAEPSGMIACESIQADLNKEYAKQLDPARLSPDDCIAHGDKFKRSGSMGLALKFYEQAEKQADRETMAFLLPRLTSCYRETDQPQKAIDILSYASKNFGQDMLNPVLLTSVAAAYCDMGDYSRAKKCCDRAYAMSNGNASGELSLVYRRVKKALE